MMMCGEVTLFADLSRPFIPVEKKAGNTKRTVPPENKNTIYQRLDQRLDLGDINRG
jgi:hypothetical protein